MTMEENTFWVVARIVNNIIKSNGCKGTFAYLDNITVGGAMQEDHDRNLLKFLSVAETHNLTFNNLQNLLTLLNY